MLFRRTVRGRLRRQGALGVWQVKKGDKAVSKAETEESTGGGGGAKGGCLSEIV